MRIVFMGSPQFAVPTLNALHSSEHSIVAVVTQPDRPVGRQLKLQPPPVKVSAEALGIQCLQPQTTKTAEFVDEIKSLKPEILVVVAYGEILRKNLLESAPLGAINLHASLLPRYRGAAPIAWAILNGEKETGCSTMRIVQAMDAGAVYLQESCPILDIDTTVTLSEKLAISGAILLRRTVDLISRNEIEPIPQDESLATYAPKLKKEDGQVNWSRRAAWISRQIRAFDPWPTTYTTWNGTLVKLWGAFPAEGETEADSGTVIAVHKQSFHVAAGERTVLEITSLQPENRPRMTALEFINGYHVRAGSTFK